MQGPAGSGLVGGVGIGTVSAVTCGLVLPGIAVGGIAAAASAGLVSGTAVTDRVTTGRRKLTEDECKQCDEIFRGTVKLEKVRITRDSTISLGAPKGVRNVIHLKSTWDHFTGESLDLTDYGFETLVHELAHVWQYQNSGTAYIPKSLWAQYAAWRRGGSRNGAYDWMKAHTEELPWERWNPEQQATAVEDYNCILRRRKRDEPKDSDEDHLAILEQYMPHIWNRFGAPRYFGPGKAAKSSDRAK